MLPQLPVLLTYLNILSPYTGNTEFKKYSIAASLVPISWDTDAYLDLTVSASSSMIVSTDAMIEIANYVYF